MPSTETSSFFDREGYSKSLLSLENEATLDTLDQLPAGRKGVTNISPLGDYDEENSFFQLVKGKFLNINPPIKWIITKGLIRLSSNIQFTGYVQEVFGQMITNGSLCLLKLAM